MHMSTRVQQVTERQALEFTRRKIGVLQRNHAESLKAAGVLRNEFGNAAVYVACERQGGRRQSGWPVVLPHEGMLPQLSCRFFLVWTCPPVMPSQAEPTREPSAGVQRVLEVPRSSNLRLKKKFTEIDRDRFLDEAFEYLARFFEKSLA